MEPVQATYRSEVQTHPLGPLLRRRRYLDVRGARVTAAMILIGCALPLVVAGFLKPDPSGVGTHTQLGLPGCLTVVATGVPCPACGMTTAFAHTVRGQWLTAVKTQPFGFALALAVMAGVLLCVHTLITGTGWSVNWYRVSPMLIVICVIAFALASWGYKMATMDSVG